MPADDMMQGPFSLDPRTQPQFNPPDVRPTGYEGPGAMIANIASQFLKGMSQGRAQRFMQAEYQRHKNLDTIQAALRAVNSSQLPDERKAELSAPLQQSMLGLFAQDLGKSEKGDTPAHGFLGWMKNFATNIVGPVPKNVDPLDIKADVLGAAFTAAADPKQQLPYLRQQADANAITAMQQAVKDAGGPQFALQRGVFQSGPVQKALEDVRKYNGGKASSAVGDFLSSLYTTPEELIRAQALLGNPAIQQPAAQPAQAEAPGQTQLASTYESQISRAQPAETAATPPPTPPGIGQRQPAAPIMVTTPVGEVHRTTPATLIQEEAYDKRGRQRGRAVDPKNPTQVVNVDYSPKFGYVYADTDTPLNPTHRGWAWQPASASLPLATMYNTQNRWMRMPVAKDGTISLYNPATSETRVMPYKADTMRGRLILSQGYIDDRFVDSQEFQQASHVDDLEARYQSLSESALRLPTKRARDAAQADLKALRGQIDQAKEQLGVFRERHGRGEKKPAGGKVEFTPEDRKQIERVGTLFGGISQGTVPVRVVQPSTAPPAPPSAQPSSAARQYVR